MGSNYIYAGLPDPSTYAGYTQDKTRLKPVVSGLLRDQNSGLADALVKKTLTPEMIAALNGKLGLDANDKDSLKFIDGESLGFSGDEFVHGAPVGHGLQRGDYDPNADGEIFWGSHTDPNAGSGGGGAGGPFEDHKPLPSGGPNAMPSPTGGISTGGPAAVSPTINPGTAPGGMNNDDYSAAIKKIMAFINGGQSNV